MGSGALIMALLLAGSSATGAEGRPASFASSDGLQVDAVSTAQIQATIEKARQRHGVPGMAAVVVFADGRTITGAAGLRESTRPTAVTPADRWHLGSNTKAITATMLARLVERGVLSWSTTIGDVLTNSIEVHPGYGPVTLRQLISHTGGTPRDFRFDGVWRTARARGRLGHLHSLRLSLATEILTNAPPKAAGTKPSYSNVGVMVAGLMAEEATGKEWEQLVLDEVMLPLGITTGGFGAPGETGIVSEPRGHRQRWFGLTPIQPGPNADNPLILGPAGTVHMSMTDYAKFLRLHLLEGETGMKLLEPESFQILHSDKESPGFGLGWGVAHQKNGQVTLTHAGSNTYWYILAWLCPREGIAIAVATNCGGTKGQRACTLALQELVKQSRSRTSP